MVGRGPLGRVGFTSAPGCLRQEGVGEALGGVTGLPALLPCLAPSHVCPFALPWEEVAGWSWGGAAILTKPPRPFLQRASRAGEGTCRRGCGEWGVRSVRLLCLLPTAPKQGRLHQPLPAESREEVVLSHPGLCHFSETSTPPPPTIPAPGESAVLAGPQRRGPVQMGGSYGLLTCFKGVAIGWRFMFAWAVWRRPWGTQATE